MRIICSYNWDSRKSRKLYKSLIICPLRSTIRMFTYFQIIMIRSKYFLVICNSLKNKIICFPRYNMLSEFSHEISGEANSIGWKFFEKRKINTGLISIITVKIGMCDKLYEIFIPFQIFCKKYDAIDFCIFPLICLSLFTNKELYTNNWLDALLFAEEIKFKCSMKIISICNCESIHT